MLLPKSGVSYSFISFTNFNFPKKHWTHKLYSDLAKNY